MSSADRLRRLIRLPERASRIRADVDAEITFHLERTERELMAQGLTAADARAEARRRFGNVEHVRRELGDMGRRGARRLRLGDFFRGWRDDVGRSVRALVREPAFAAVVTVTLALGLGANATMFRVLDRVLLRPAPHIRDDGTLSLLYFQRETREFGRVTQTSQSYPVFEYMRSRLARTTDLAAWWISSSTSGRGAEARQLEVSFVTPNFFDVLGVRPWAGRAFGQEDWTGSGEPAAVLTHAFAVDRFGSPSAAIGQTLPVNGTVHTVIGVAPPGFLGPVLRPVDLFITMQQGVGQQVGREWATNKNMRWLQMVARRAPGVSPEQASAAATAALRDVGRTLDKDDVNGTVVVGSIIPARRPNGTTSARIALWLGGVTLLVLLVACANVANLLLARTIRRRRELAVHLALGVSRARVARLLLAESLLLGAIAGALALVVAMWGESALRATILRDMPWDSSAIDVRSAAFVAVLAAVAAVLAGVAPAFVAAHTPLMETLKSGVREGGGRRGRLRRSLVIVQGTFSVVLLVGAGLFVRSFQRASSMDLGYQPRGVVVATPLLQGLTRTPEEYEAAWRRLEESLRRLPGVTGVSQTVTIPFESQWDKPVLVNGDTLAPQQGGGPHVNAVGSDYFTVMGTPVIRGREFTPQDTEGSAPVTIVNERLAELLWPGKDPIGECIGIGDLAGCATVVGVVPDPRVSSLTDRTPPHYFQPLGQWTPDMRSLVVRVAEEGGADANAIRRALVAAEPSLPYIPVRTLTSIVDEQLQSWRVAAMLFTVFGGLGLLVAALGLYSVIAHDVAQRAQEIGVRMALGARRSDVVRLVMRRGVAQALVGVGLGLAIAAALGPRVADLLFETSPRDPLIYGIVLVLLVAVAIVATAVPARRASRLDPVEVLKES